MIKHGKILVPTDFSKASAEALRRAGKLALAFDAEVHLLHVIEPIIPIDLESMPVLPDEAMNQAVHERAETRLAEMQQTADYPVTVHLHESLGRTADFICDFASEEEMDLIVIGRQGTQGLIEHWLLGSTAEHVVRQAPCSVLVSMPHALLAD